MKKFYQDSDSFVHVVVSDRNKLAEIFCEYGIFVFHSSVYGETAAYNERIACTSVREDMDPACESFDFVCDDSETWVSIMGKFEKADVYFNVKGRSAVVFLKIKGLGEIEILMDNGPVMIPV